MSHHAKFFQKGGKSSKSRNNKFGRVIKSKETLKSLVNTALPGSIKIHKEVLPEVYAPVDTQAYTFPPFIIVGVLVGAIFLGLLLLF